MVVTLSSRMVSAPVPCSQRLLHGYPPVAMQLKGPPGDPQTDGRPASLAQEVQRAEPVRRTEIGGQRACAQAPFLPAAGRAYGRGSGRYHQAPVVCATAYTPDTRLDSIRLTLATSPLVQVSRPCLFQAAIKKCPPLDGKGRALALGLT
jgi:hypothetical protein